MRRDRLPASRFVIALAGLAAILPLAACAAFFDLSKLGADSELDAAVAETGTDASDGGADAQGDGALLDEDSSAPCTYEAGAAMKRIGIYCIDSKEATNGEYAAFLERSDAGSASTAPGCSADVDRVPAENWPSPPEWNDLPVTGVSWCDAHAFCAAAGKRLCGKRGGGSLAANAPTRTDALANEWYRACSKAGTRRLPYGDEPVVGECATVRQLRASSGKCEGGYVGIFDMVGNAEEWTNACETDEAAASCVVQGGSALDSLADCTTGKPYPRHLKRPLVGIRCCAD